MGLKPLAIDLYCGLGGWTEGLLAEGYRVVGFDIERHVYGEHCYPAQLVLQDVLTLDGRQFKDADLIVASPPCQEYSYMAMPWSKAKQIEREYQDGTRDTSKLTALFDACFRIQREACEASGRHIPLVVENVRGAQKWVGRSRWNFGSFHLWGDVPALMPMTRRELKGFGGTWFHNKELGTTNPNRSRTATDPREGQKNPGFRFDGSGRSFQSASVEGLKMPTGDSTVTAKGRSAALGNYDVLREEIKQGGDWFNKASGNSISRRCSSRSKARKHAAAMIAKIPLTLSRHIGQAWYPERAA